MHKNKSGLSRDQYDNLRWIYIVFNQFYRTPYLTVYKNNRKLGNFLLNRSNQHIEFSLISLNNKDYHVL